MTAHISFAVQYDVHDLAGHRRYVHARFDTRGDAEDELERLIAGLVTPREGILFYAKAARIVTETACAILGTYEHGHVTRRQMMRPSRVHVLDGRRTACGFSTEDRRVFTPGSTTTYMPLAAIDCHACLEVVFDLDNRKEGR